MASSADDAVAGAAAPGAAIVDTTHHQSTELHIAEKSGDADHIPITPGSNSDDFKDALQQQHGQTQPADVVTPLPTSTVLTAPAPAETPAPPLTRQESEALGPASEAPIAHPKTSAAGSLTLSISLMLITGARHPYKIDEKYLRSRNIESVDAQGEFDPRAISGYQLKELVWTDWRPEWEPRPASPSSIRLIIMGRMIDDKFALRDFPFNIESTNVLHMTVKPADLIDDEETGAKGTGKAGVLRARDTEDRGAGCRCVIL